MRVESDEELSILFSQWYGRYIRKTAMSSSFFHSTVNHFLVLAYHQKQLYENFLHTIDNKKAVALDKFMKVFVKHYIIYASCHFESIPIPCTKSTTSSLIEYTPETEETPDSGDEECQAFVKHLRFTYKKKLAYNQKFIYENKFIHFLSLIFSFILAKILKSITTFLYILYNIFLTILNQELIYQQQIRSRKFEEIFRIIDIDYKFDYNEECDSELINWSIQEAMDDYLPSILKRTSYLFQDLNQKDFNSIFLLLIEKLSADGPDSGNMSCLSKNREKRQFSLLFKKIIKDSLQNMPSSSLEKAEMILYSYCKIYMFPHSTDYEIKNTYDHSKYNHNIEQCKKQPILCTLMNKLNNSENKIYSILEIFNSHLSDLTKIRVFGALYAFLEHNESLPSPAFKKQFQMIMSKNITKFWEILGVCKFSTEKTDLDSILIPHHGLAHDLLMTHFRSKVLKIKNR